MPEESERNKEPNAIALAMVALNEPHLPFSDHYRLYLEQNFPDLPRPISVDIIGKENLEALTVRLGDLEGFVGLMSVPIPWSDLEGPCLTAWWWPEATERLKEHKAHAIVTLLKRTDDIVANYLLVTKLAACLAATTNSAGVYWGAGTVVHPPEGFIEQSKDADSDNLPLALWIDFRIQKAGDGKYQLLTTGLEGLNKREIEIGPCALSPKELLGLVYDVAHYILTSGTEIRNGHTIGRSAAEKIRIRFTKSIWNRPGEVMRLEVP